MVYYFAAFVIFHFISFQEIWYLVINFKPQVLSEIRFELSLFALKCIYIFLSGTSPMSIINKSKRRIIIDTSPFKQTKISDFFNKCKIMDKKISARKIDEELPIHSSDDEDDNLEDPVVNNSNHSSSKTNENNRDRRNSEQSFSSDDTIIYNLPQEVRILENIVITSNENMNNELANKRSSETNQCELMESPQKIRCVTSESQRNFTWTPQSTSSLQNASTPKTPTTQLSPIPKIASTPENSSTQTSIPQTSTPQVLSTPPTPQISMTPQLAQFPLNMPITVNITLRNNQQLDQLENLEVQCEARKNSGTPLKTSLNVRNQDSKPSTSKRKLFDSLKKSQSSPKAQKSPRKYQKSPSKSPSNAPTNSRAKCEKDESMKQEEKLNFKNIDCMKELFKDTLDNLDKRRLLSEAEVLMIEDYLKMSIECQYLLLKLFLNAQKWYNLTDYTRKIKLDQRISLKEIHSLYDSLREKEYIDTDLRSLDVDTLLNLCTLPQLKILGKKLKITIKDTKREDIIKSIKKHVRTQKTLSKTTPELIIKRNIIEILGIQLKLKENVKKTLSKAYIIQVYTNPDYIDPQKYFSDKNFLNITYPDYTVENYSVFVNKEQFSSYFEAVFLRDRFIKNLDKKNYEYLKVLAGEAFSELSNISPDGKSPSYVPEHLQKFSAEYQYISILNLASRRLLRYHNDVKSWLEFLISSYKNHYHLGNWYRQLVHIHIHYLKDYEQAAKIAIEAFELNKKRNCFDVIQVHDLSELSTKIWTSKSYKISRLYRDELARYAENPIKGQNFVKKTISAQTDRNLYSKSSTKRIYSFTDAEGVQNYGSVESIALNHYRLEEGYRGVHCEGRILLTYFTLLFWDVIYEYYVPNTFISKHQHTPLDLYQGFYKNRKDEIDKRLKDISENWSQEELETTLKENFSVHSHEKSIIKLDTNTDEDLLVMLKCIKRTVLAKIFERFVSNFKCFSSGLPDLYLWKTESSECKFVEIKGEGDKLSLKQILWVQYLMDIGASVEVCHVTGVGGKIRKANFEVID